jgi:hypothetical protein
MFETGVTTQRDIYQGPDGSITWLSATELYAKGFDYEAFSFEDGAVMFTTVGALPNTAPVGPFNPPTNTASDIDIYLKCYLRAKVWVNLLLFGGLLFLFFVTLPDIHCLS